MKNLQENKTKRWFGQYLGVRYEINNFKRPNIEGGESDSWTYYLFINLSIKYNIYDLKDYNK